jgi:hypothetical protein
MVKLGMDARSDQTDTQTNHRPRLTRSCYLPRPQVTASVAWSSWPAPSLCWCSINSPRDVLLIYPTKFVARFCPRPHATLTLIRILVGRCLSELGCISGMSPMIGCASSSPSKMAWSRPRLSCSVLGTRCATSSWGSNSTSIYIYISYGLIINL